MPELVLYRDEDGRVPLLDWLRRLPDAAVDRCRAALQRLQQEGFRLRRPTADLLDDGIYELRIKYRGLNYRILYFFHGRQAVIVSHGFLKQRAIVPARELATAKERRRRFEDDPAAHSAREQET
jgi:phage-related protein